MAKTIVQTVVFKNTTCKALYELYMDAKKHSLVTGGPASISEKIGSPYSAHGGYISWALYMKSLREFCQTGKGEAFGSDSHRK